MATDMNATVLFLTFTPLNARAREKEGIRKECVSS